MATVFQDKLFIKTELVSVYNAHKITLSLKEAAGRFNGDLLRSDSTGYLEGFMVSPTKIPSWMVPGIVLIGMVQGMKCVCTYEGVVQSNISILSDILGDRVKFSYTTTSEYE